jgi:hypothetical protein
MVDPRRGKPHRLSAVAWSSAGTPPLLLLVVRLRGVLTPDRLLPGRWVRTRIVGDPHHGQVLKRWSRTMPGSTMAGQAAPRAAQQALMARNSWIRLIAPPATVRVK